MLDRPTLLLKAILAGETYGLSTLELTEMQEAAHVVYEEVAYDMADHDVEGYQTCSRENVMEVVIDADRLFDEIHRCGKMTPKIEALLHSGASFATHDDILDMIGPAFLDEEYEIGGS